MLYQLDARRLYCNCYTTFIHIDESRGVVWQLQCRHKIICRHRITYLNVSKWKEKIKKLSKYSEGIKPSILPNLLKMSWEWSENSLMHISDPSKALMQTIWELDARNPDIWSRQFVLNPFIQWFWSNWFYPNNLISILIWSKLMVLR